MEDTISIEDWIQEGIQKGLQQGQAEGARQTLRENILQILQGRFGLSPQLVAPLEQQLADVDDIAALERLLDHALLDTMAVDFAVNLGRHTGQMEGARRMLRENILRILEVRFGLPPKRVDALARRLAAIDDISELKRLLDRALQDVTIVDFEARLARLGHLAAEAASN